MDALIADEISMATIGEKTKRRYRQGYWSKIIPNTESITPCPRSLHAGAIWGNYFYVFGGYDGHQRCNDLHRYDFLSNSWILLEPVLITPSRRDRHSAVVYANCFYVFGGFDGRSRVNGMYFYTRQYSKI